MSLTAGTVYKHVQEVAATVWTIAHGTGSYPAVDVYVDNEGTIEKIMPQRVSYVSPTVCTVTFSSPRTGFATVC